MSAHWHAVAFCLVLLSGCTLDGRRYRATERNFIAGTVANRLLGETPPVSAPIEHIQVAPPVVLPPLTPENYLSATPFPITLEDAIRTALDNSEIVRTIGGDSAVQAATIYDPVSAETDVRGALAQFDETLSITQSWQKTDQPGSAISDISDLSVGIGRQFITGTQVATQFDYDYLFRPQLLGDVPAHRTQLEWALFQPILRGGGIAVNRAPLIIARARSERSLWEFQTSLQAMVRSVETAYWRLQAGSENIKAIDEVEQLAAEVVRVERARLDQRVTVEADVAQAESRLQSIRQRRIALIADLLSNETLLRNLLGLPPSDGRRIVPTQNPVAARLVFDWDSTIAEALASRPDVVTSRLSVLIGEKSLLLARNDLLPDLQATMGYNHVGDEDQFDQSVSHLFEGSNTNWNIGFSVQTPLKNHGAGANAQAAELSLARRRAELKQTVHASIHAVTDSIRNLAALHAQVELAGQRVQSAGRFRDGSKARYDNPRADSELLLLLNTYLSSLDEWANAFVVRNQLLSDYNVALATFDEVKGTILRRHGVAISESPWESLPPGLYRQYLGRFGHPRRFELPSGTPPGGIELFRSYNVAERN